MVHETEEPRDDRVGEMQHTDEGDQIGNEIAAYLQGVSRTCQQCIDDIVLFTRWLVFNERVSKEFDLR